MWCPEARQLLPQLWPGVDLGSQALYRGHSVVIMSRAALRAQVPFLAVTTRCQDSAPASFAVLGFSMPHTASLPSSAFPLPIPIISTPFYTLALPLPHRSWCRTLRFLVQDPGPLPLEHPLLASMSSNPTHPLSCSAAASSPPLFSPATGTPGYDPCDSSIQPKGYS